jgi:hypothetical protein
MGLRLLATKTDTKSGKSGQHVGIIFADTKSYHINVLTAAEPAFVNTKDDVPNAWTVEDRPYVSTIKGAINVQIAAEPEFVYTKDYVANAKSVKVLVFVHIRECAANVKNVVGLAFASTSGCAVNARTAILLQWALVTKTNDSVLVAT